MAVENAEAPGRQHEESRAGKEHPDDRDRQLALFAVESGSDDRDEQRRGENTGDDENRRDERQQRRDGSGDALGLRTFTACNERRVHGDERRGQRAFTEQILQKIRYPEGRHERVRRIG